MALDYGLRISYDGKDVKTCDDIDCVITSKYPLLKQNEVYDITSLPIPPNSLYTNTHAHGLGYPPFVYGYVKDVTETFWRTIPWGTQVGIDENWNHWIYTDSTNLYVKTAHFGGTGNKQFQYRIFICLENGKI